MLNLLFIIHTFCRKCNEILAVFSKNGYTENGVKNGTLTGRKGRCAMDFIEKIGDTITTLGKGAADKAKDVAEIASLKSQIATCEEVIKKNYLEIGRLFMEQYKDAKDAPFEKQRRAITNAQAGVEDLQRKIREIKGI